MTRWMILLGALGLSAQAAAQMPFPLPRLPLPRLPVPQAQPPQTVLMSIDSLRAEFVARSGSDKVYFAGTSASLDANARATLTAQAAWLRMYPMLVVRIEGHGDATDTRSHALAVGAARAEAVRDFLLLQGVPAAQVTTSSFGKERPARPGFGENVAALNRRAVTVLVR